MGLGDGAVDPALQVIPVLQVGLVLEVGLDHLGGDVVVDPVLEVGLDLGSGVVVDPDLVVILGLGGGEVGLDLGVARLGSQSIPDAVGVEVKKKKEWNKKKKKICSKHKNKKKVKNIFFFKSDFEIKTKNPIQSIGCRNARSWNTKKKIKIALRINFPKQKKKKSLLKEKAQEKQGFE